ncbi:MAG TPA: hypothetical protein VMS74_09670 [Acidimicrobiia bacterium]|nr:hypothetical protein [Acidimicrobiia bacterium]
MSPLTISVADLKPDASRLIARPFLPGGPNYAGGSHRLDSITRRIKDLSPSRRVELLTDARRRARRTYSNVEDVWRGHFNVAAVRSPSVAAIEDEGLQLLLGACFTQSYAYEAAALSNPSVVPIGPLGGETQAFVMSARAIGEGHISSVAFFTGSVTRDGVVTLESRYPHASNGVRKDVVLRRASFAGLLEDMGLLDEPARRLLSLLDDEFTAVDLELVAARFEDYDVDPGVAETTWKNLHWVASSNYHVTFDSSLPVSEHVLSPASPAESHGIEDARFVRFEDGDDVRFFATYTAFDGSRILPQLIETADFNSFDMSTLTGPAVHHKGMALFPRRVDGEYLALSRHDHERIFLTRSDDLASWTNAEVLFEPEFGWDAVQMGNCGSPLETDAGWLVLTHGVGPMRRYVIGAMLLDRDSPHKVIGRLSRPLIEPRDLESDGYVPDVVYSCGAMIHHDVLVIPYGYADYGIRIAVTLVDEVLAEMTS